MNKKNLCLLMILLAGNAWGAEPAAAIADCANSSDVKSKSRQLFEGQTLMFNLLSLEAQGEANFHPQYVPPASQCVFEKFEVAGSMVQAIHSPFEKGESTLHWRFSAGGAEPRELLVIYDGLASFMAKKDSLVFFVVEERKGNISYYAMFRDQPTYAALKPIAISILDGSAKPLATVRWPPGEKEAVIEAYDGKRLK